MERIFVTFKPVGRDAGYSPAYHMALNYERIVNGETVTTRIEGSPTKDVFKPWAVFDVLQAPVSRNIFIQKDNFLNITIRENPNDSFAKETIVSGDNLSQKWNQILELRNQINNDKYYRHPSWPLSQLPQQSPRKRASSVPGARSVTSGSRTFARR